MEFQIANDIESVLEITGYNMDYLAKELGVSRITIHNWIKNRSSISDKHLEEFYSFAYKRGIRLNILKEQFYREDMVKNNEILLFHGAKTEISGKLRLDQNKKTNDFGNGFYSGESLEQSVMFVAGQKHSTLYMLKFNPAGLRCKEFYVDRDWMLTIAYHRGRLKEFENSRIVKNIIKKTENIDYIVAPIADNRMFEIIDSFIDGEITDVQAQHCLSATNLGKQYVFVSERALAQITLLEKCYLTDLEKDAYIESRQESFRMNMDKVKLARKQYRNQGDYIEDIIK